MSFELHLGNCLDILATMPDNSVDAIVTDPPYGLAFMGKKWDYDVPSEEIWRECLRVLKPGGHLLAFAGTRTQHRMAVRIEDAGFEIRDMIAWVYGSGFPKSHDISKAIDKAAGVERTEVIGTKLGLPGMAKDGSNQRSGFDAAFGGDACGLLSTDITAPATLAAKQWQGWGTALKPALEPITVARKPFTGTVAANVLQWGTGGVNVDGCRVEGNVTTWPAIRTNNRNNANAYGTYASQETTGTPSTLGRFPANLIHDGSDEVVGMFPETKTGKPTLGSQPTTGEVFGAYAQRSTVGGVDSGSAARFFYCAKASKRDRDEGCEGMEAQNLRYGDGRGRSHEMYNTTSDNRPTPTNPARTNHHPTVKPTDLMRYLCRLVTPPNGTVLDPFMGSGSTGKAAILEGFQFIGIDMTPEYVDIARARIEHAVKSKPNKLDLE
jgi:site-specific DNA-methyltransferase (adenine-specific)